MWSKLLAVLALITATSAAVYYIWFDSTPSPFVTQASSTSPPLRVGNRVYLLTTQSKLTPDFGDSPSNILKDMERFLDLWAFDTDNAKPVYRQRLRTISGGNVLGYSFLGAHNQTLWLLLASELHAINRESGVVSGNAEKIGSLNPTLRSLIPTEQRYFEVNPEGLTIQAADARTWYLHPDTLIASKTPPVIESKGVPTPYVDPQSMDAFYKRGVNIGKRWLGLLTHKESVDLNGMSSRYSQTLGAPTRRSLYAADITNERIGNFKPITEDFLAPGLLAEHRPTGGGAVILRRNPDSVFILHRDRLGQDGKLFLARVASPEGKILWNTALNLSILQTIMPDDQSLLLFGRRYPTKAPNVDQSGDPYQAAHEILIALDWATGTLKSFDFSDIEHHPAATLNPLL